MAGLGEFGGGVLAALGLRIPRWLTLGGLALTAVVVAYGALGQPDQQEQQPEQGRDEGRDEVVEVPAAAPRASGPRDRQQRPDVAAVAEVAEAQLQGLAEGSAE